MNSSWISYASDEIDHQPMRHTSGGGKFHFSDKAVTF